MPASAGRSTTRTLAPRFVSSAARARRAACTFSFVKTLASKTMIVSRSVQVTRLKQGSGPFSSTRSPVGLVALPVTPRQPQQPLVAIASACRRPMRVSASIRANTDFSASTRMTATDVSIRCG